MDNSVDTRASNERDANNTSIYFYGHSGNKPYKQFSNFYPSEFTYFNIPFKTGEHALHWRKAMLFQDYKTAKQILQSKTPSQAKKLGRIVKNFEESKWASKRFDYMVEILVTKFSNPELKDVLLGTAQADIYEATSTDKVWAIGISVADGEAGKAHRGSNLLGRALMAAREKLLG